MERTPAPEALITVRDLTMAFGDFVVMRDLGFRVRRGQVFIIMGGSGCGKSVLMRHMVGLLEPARGEVLFHGIAVKPGKPTAFGRIDGKLVFGMPGYPTSCLSNAYILLAPALRRIARLLRRGE